MSFALMAQKYEKSGVAGKACAIKLQKK